MSLDAIIDIQVDLGAGAISVTGFGTPMLVASSTNLNAGFTERVRSYSTLAAAEADADLGAAVLSRLTQMFGQAEVPSVIKVGRRSANVAQVDTVTVTGNDDGDYTIQINGTDYTHSASGQTTDQIAAALQVLVDADPDVGAGVVGSVVTITASSAGIPFTTTVTAISDNLSLVNTTANTGVAESMALILAEDSDFFHFCLDTRDDGEILEAALWASGATRMFWGQTSTAAVATSATDDIGSELKSRSLRWSPLFYYTDDSEFLDANVMTRFAAFDFDSTAPTAEFLTLSGTPTEELGDTAQGYLDGKNVNYYTTLFGTGASANGSTPAGYDIEHVVTGKWLEARGSEAVARLFLRESNAGRRVKFTDRGFAQVEGEFFAVLKTGEELEHFAEGTSETSVPRRSAVASADVESGTLRITFGTLYTGRVKSVVIRGEASLSFAGL